MYPTTIIALMLAMLPADRQEVDLSPIVNGSNQFAFDLYAELAQETGNLFFSPNSLSSALAMTYAGARGETAEQMRQVLHLPDDPEQIHPAHAKRIALYNDRERQEAGGYELAVANALWGQTGFRFHEQFKQLLHRHYSAGLTEVDFIHATEQARAQINQWIERQTRDRITDLIPEGVLDPDTRLVLTNAIYFKATWMFPFSPATTREEEFWLSNDELIETPMMNQTAEYGYREEDDLQILHMPYGDGTLAMVILLPSERDGLDDLQKQLSAERLEQWLEGIEHRNVVVSLPRFRIEDSFRLAEVLPRMGMPLAFSGAADFSGMTDEARLAIDEVLHKSFVDVDEHGTEAAAATAVVMKRVSAELEPPPVFRADRPFVFLIRDTQTGAILFLGRLVNPKWGIN